MQSIKVTKKEVPAMLLAAYPDYKGRKYRVEYRENYYMQNYWSEGSRYYCKAVELSSGRVVDPAHISTNPFRKEAHATIGIPEGVCIVEHIFFCGKDMGLRFIFNPVNAPKWIGVAK